MMPARLSAPMSAPGTANIVAIDPIVISMPVIHRGGVPVLAGVPRRSMEMMLVRVTTDAGLVGWGEAFGLYNAWPAARVALQTVIAPRCIGRNALDRDALIDEMQRALHPLGRNGVVMHAWSGVEMALWDIAGKALGLPLHRLLGGAWVDSLKAYASLPRYGSTSAVLHDCEEAVARGFDAVKLHEITVPEIRAAAKALAVHGIGGLMIDANCPWSLEQALDIAGRIADLDIKWLEEPLYPPDDYESLALLRKQGGIPTAAGENARSVSDFATMLRLDAVDYMQPSIAKLGGVSAMREVFALASGTGVEVAPHTPFFGPALLATTHLCAALAPDAKPEAYFLDLEGNPFEEAVHVQDGRMRVPQGPGIGFDPDPGLLARSRLP